MRLRAQLDGDVVEAGEARPADVSLRVFVVDNAALLEAHKGEVVWDLGAVRYGTLEVEIPLEAVPMAAVVLLGGVPLVGDEGVVRADDLSVKEGDELGQGRRQIADREGAANVALVIDTANADLYIVGRLARGLAASPDCAG